MWSFGPDLIQTMCAALDAVMAGLPVDQATPAVKTYVAEFILRAAAEGQTNYEGLVATATSQVQTLLSLFT
jgi:hypothetical protein